MNQPFQITKFNFGTLQFYENYVISTQNEGVHIGINEHNKIMSTIIDYFGDKKFIYIANRKHSYSIDVMVYYEVIKVKNLLAIAVVNYLKTNVSTYTMESHFLKKKSKEFDELETAIKWASTLLEN
ncbi:hypothetical protein [Winogradskyella immobilis]|uniref:STAS/SEC14 domain-containing protein n=1 Tax=Winogradskyella immobilis TaxID=2816852 RepID=A0ABS8EKG4_9FLAO|nr:hypothetical protein [Winogradskyella immobilis]MCC1483691.1 hypothetical protein [Winogradskyella immobilis]MCG0015785.1 hypothetical protein [Winogradskyella immobilis]